MLIEMRSSLEENSNIKCRREVVKSDNTVTELNKDKTSRSDCLGELEDKVVGTINKKT